MDQIKTGEFLRTLRKEKNLTQEELAEKFGISNRSVSRWENGNNMPDLSLLVELADFYGVDIGELISGGRKEKVMDAETKEEIKAVAEYAENEKKEIRKKSKKKTVAVAVILTVIFLAAGFAANFIVGNPVSYFLAKHNAQTFVEGSPYFAESGYEITGVNYDFVLGHYLITAQAGGSPDSKVYLYYGFTGNYLWDDSAEVRDGKKNVISRMNFGYSALVRKTLTAESVPELDDVTLGQIATEGEFEQDAERDYIRIVPADELYHDEVFDYEKLGAESGVITVGFNSKDLSAEKMAEKLLALKDVCDRGGLRFAAATVFLTDRDESENDGSGFDSVMIEYFPYCKIDAENLAQQISEYMVK